MIEWLAEHPFDDLAEEDKPVVREVNEAGLTCGLDGRSLTPAGRVALQVYWRERGGAQ